MTDGDSGLSRQRDHQIGALLNDYFDRRARGVAEAEAEFLARYPELADELREHLAILQDLTPRRDTIRSLIAQGVLEPSDNPRYPARLGPYQVIEFIGRGGMGLVVKAYEESLNRTVALKILRPELAEDAAALARFGREARTAAALRHPNIVTVYAVGREGNTHYLAMEFVEGPTLAEVIREHGPLPSETIRQLLGQLLDGLAAAHKAGLIHRDIKAANILLEYPAGSGTDHRTTAIADSAIVRIADFGLARMQSSQTRLTLEGAAPGTPEYMSPEQAAGEPGIDHRSDLYSAGVVLYEMLTGRTPFNAPSPSAVVNRVLRDEPEPPTRVHPHADGRLSNLALRLMAKRPEDRLESAPGAAQLLKAGTRVGLPASRRRTGLRARYLATALAVLCGLTWLIGFTLRSTVDGAITGLRVDPERPYRLLVERGYSAEYTELRRFPETVKVRDTVVAEVGPHLEQTVIVAIEGRFNDANLLALAQDGRTLWGMTLENDLAWPDCEPTGFWICFDVVAGDLDGKPGDELVVNAGDRKEYPTHLVVIDPTEPTIRSRFWHFGNIDGLIVEPGLLPDGRTAIVAWGKNNKLDGFDAPPPEDILEFDEPVTQWRQVSVAMVLDPATMDGLGPPRTTRLPGVSPARPFAYAFLDLAGAEYIPSNDPDRPDSAYPDAREPASLQQIKRSPDSLDDPTKPPLELTIRRPEQKGGAIIAADANLAIQAVSAFDSEILGQSEDYWVQRWRLVIRNGAYVTDQSDPPD